MRPICTIPFVGIMILAGLSFSISGNMPVREPSIPEPGFAVVELFTSEGCSSCPAADELAITLSKEYKSNVYFLGYHVDYWNDIGWNDKFSKADHTKRQKKYAAVFNLSSIYTPQVVVNGKRELVGSDQFLLRTAIREGLKTNSPVDIKLAARIDKDEVSVSYATSASDKNMLKIAFVQVHAETSVKKGENSGRYLRHLNVVRDLQSIALNKKGEGEINFKIPADMAVSNAKIIAFVQDKDDLRILGATSRVIE